MAQGEFIRFNQWKVDKGKKIHDLESDEIKFAAIKGASNGGIDPTKGLADPRWGAGGSTDLSAHEVAADGNYAAGGKVVACVWEAVGDDVRFTSNASAPQISWAEHVDNPTNAEFLIAYNNTAAGKQCLGYIDLGGVKDMSNGDLNHTVDTTNGFFIER